MYSDHWVLYIGVVPINSPAPFFGANAHINDVRIENNRLRHDTNGKLCFRAEADETHDIDGFLVRGNLLQVYDSGTPVSTGIATADTQASADVTWRDNEADDGTAITLDLVP